MLKRNETLSSLTWEMLARKNIKKHKRLALRLEALYLVKNIFRLYFSPIPKLWSRKKVIFKVFVFWRYFKTLNPQLFYQQIDKKKNKQKNKKKTFDKMMNCLICFSIVFKELSITLWNIVNSVQALIPHDAAIEIAVSVNWCVTQVSLC